MIHYRIHEIFQTLQGEGFYVGTPSVFVRFSGCNLRCPFCDTIHEGGRLMTCEEIVAEVMRYATTHVVLTGGEPSLFVTEELTQALHAIGKIIAIETNGTHQLPHGIDWVTLSPKDCFLTTASAKPILKACDELKVVYDGNPVNTYSGISARHRFLQPCDTGDTAQNATLTAEAVAWCLSHPDWRLSLQTHKLINIP